jgi:hypothetical protein
MKVTCSSHSQEKSGQHNYQTTKKERNALKAGKGAQVTPTGSIWVVCIFVVLGALLLAGFVYYMATLELEGEEVDVEVEEK